MNKQILINIEPQEKRVALLEGNSLEEFYVERIDQPKLVGSIYKGKVAAVLPGMDAAFVELGLEKNGFLHVSDVIERPSDYDSLVEEIKELPRKTKSKGAPLKISNVLKKGDEILVQIVKEPMGTKGPRLTTHISLPGRFLVLVPYEEHIGISKKISQASERHRIKKMLEQIKVPKGVGVIVRTAAGGCSHRQLAGEISYLVKLWNTVKSKEKSTRIPSLIHQEHDLALRVVRDVFAKDVKVLMVDSKEEYKKIAHFVRFFLPTLKRRLKLYRNATPLFERYGIEKELAKIYENRIYLKRKGYIIIEQTEGLVAIDVNTGGYVGKKDLEETALATNMEAAKEIARQIRLRDMGGIIVIDFIDMESREHRQRVFNALNQALKRDKARTKVLGISSFGLVEMTRQRMRKSVESLSYKVCPYCGGRGSVKSPITMSIEAKRKLERVLKQRSKRQLVVYAHPEVIKNLLTQDRGSISYLENRFKSKIALREDPKLHVEEIKITDI